MRWWGLSRRRLAEALSEEYEKGSFCQANLLCLARLSVFAYIRSDYKPAMLVISNKSGAVYRRSLGFLGANNVATVNGALALDASVVRLATLHFEGIVTEPCGRREY